MYNRQLETFIEAADAGSFNKAAEKLYITPPAVIKQVNLLEAKLGLILFKRTHRGLVLTEAGKSLYRDSKYMIQYGKDSVVRAQNALQDGGNTIRIGISPMTPAQILVELRTRIQKQCPDIKFQLITFENTPENAREILKNLGQNIDIVAGIFDETMLKMYGCEGLELMHEPVCCAISIHHRLANRKKLEIRDLYGETLMVIRPRWSSNVDRLRDDIWKHHPQIQIKDFDFYNVSVFNQCENSNDILLAIGNWENVHPLLKIIPVEWEYSIPYGLLHSPYPSEIVRRLLLAVQSVLHS